MYEVTCATCATQVLVEKFSPVHTSIQWTTDARTACPEFARHIAEGRDPDRIPGCEALRASIDDQVRRGRVPTDSLRREPTPGQFD
ncbi:MAG: hypothetical protein WBA05_06905 [Gordonia sp. (in: high G+C Gram-positive bacteria)]|uniref:hypothetical protein n=1 Tax=Gordonia sp. (in: high G+C Gram-positive bacteria) TaxID=84139 RepID=UPI003C744BD1